jgi:hypothetical protein
MENDQLKTENLKNTMDSTKSETLFTKKEIKEENDKLKK